MRRWLRHYARWARHYARPEALVLMYHRVAEPDTDIWDLAVSPAHFEQQLRVLQQLGTVIPATELAERLQSQTLKRRSIVITFDDGYLDNYLTASPLLARYQLPATFFIVSGQVGLTQEFWWDELVSLLLLTEHLPAAFSLALPGEASFTADLRAEQHLTPKLRQQHQHWRANEETPPTQRAALYYQLWEYIKPLPAPAQQQVLQQLRTWAGQLAGARPAFQSVSLPQLRELSTNPLFTIGAHTVTHPALACHPAAVQTHELAAGRQALHETIGLPINLVAYPYGSHSSETAIIAAQLGFKAAFTTKAQAVTPTTAVHRMGRFQVNNWNGAEFKRCLNQWFSQ
jgi:peptidoglycan/xylan/chitin deacetylase (PgdA/CDA1 family)